jgi:succinate dehydrogenase hydrophobic anchor subunit
MEQAVKKYQWHDASLKRKSQMYDWAMLGFAGVALVVRLLWADMSSGLLLILLAGAMICFMLSWRLKSQDAKLNKNEAQSPEIIHGVKPKR